MMQTFTAVFLAEVRTARRLARTWVFAVLAVATTCIGYVYFTALHASMSRLLPRFLVDSFGGYLLWFLMAAAVFLGLDLGSREQRERIADALDTRPVSNIQLLAGRLAGVVATLAVPVAGLLVISQGVGLLGQAFDWPIRATFEPVSLGVFLAVDALPALVLWVAIVFLLAAVLRSRLAVAGRSLDSEEEDRRGEEEDRRGEEEDRRGEEEDRRGEEEDRRLEESDRRREEEDLRREEEDLRREEEDLRREEADLRREGETSKPTETNRVAAVDQTRLRLTPIPRHC